MEHEHTKTKRKIFFIKKDPSFEATFPNESLKILRISCVPQTSKENQFLWTKDFYYCSIRLKISSRTKINVYREKYEMRIIGQDDKTFK